MANNDDKGTSEPLGGWDPLLWSVLGLIAGILLTQKYLDFLAPVPGSLQRAVFVFVMIVGPTGLLVGIGVNLRDEVLRGKITLATYWSTMFGIATAMFALLGIAGP